VSVARPLEDAQHRSPKGGGSSPGVARPPEDAQHRSPGGEGPSSGVIRPRGDTHRPLLQVRGLKRRFGGNLAVDGVGFDLEAGELLALIGPNGAGKSTTFNLVGGQLAAEAGSVCLGGQELLGLPARRIVRLGVGRTFQIAAVFHSLTVIQNVQLARLTKTGQWRDAWRGLGRRGQEEAMALLEQVGMADQADRPCSELAYGDVKRVELAVSLASDPCLLLMDEPTAGMAPAERRALVALVKRLVTERGLAVLFTEHSMDVVFAYADRVLVMARGRLIAEGTPAEIKQDAAVRTAYFGSGAAMEEVPAAPASAAAARPEASVEAQPEPITEGIDTPTPQRGGHQGRLAVDEEGPLPTSAERSHPLLELAALHGWYGDAHVLQGLDLSIGRGEVVALMGRNGAGKSTTFKAIMGMLERRAGEVRWQGRALPDLRPYQVARLGLGYVPEDRRVFSELTVAENLDAGRQPARYWPDGSGVPTWGVEQILELFPPLTPLMGRVAGSLSGGEQQMLTVGRTLMGNPCLVLLDEPSEGVAPLVVERMMALVRHLKTAGVSVLLSEQNLAFARGVADRAYVLDRGVIRGAGSLETLMADERMLRDFLAL